MEFKAFLQCTNKWYRMPRCLKSYIREVHVSAFECAVLESYGDISSLSPGLYPIHVRFPRPGQGDQRAAHCCSHSEVSWASLYLLCKHAAFGCPQSTHPDTRLPPSGSLFYRIPHALKFAQELRIAPTTSQASPLEPWSSLPGIF